MIYFTSDTHFNDKRIIELRGRRHWQSVAAMNHDLIERWNFTVGKKDEVYVLGDFGYHWLDAPHSIGHIFHSLHGKKHLIIGNHDEQNPKVLQLPWTSQSYLAVLHQTMPAAVTTPTGSAKVGFVLCHYPIERWWRMEKGYIHLHGHIHGGTHRPTSTIPHRFDVGVDCHGYVPVVLEQFVSIASQQPFDPTEYYMTRADGGFTTEHT